jgi:hypothetical protein
MRPYLKAAAAALFAFSSGLTVATPDGVSGWEWVTVAAGTVAAAGAVFVIPYKPTTGRVLNRKATPQV